MEAVKGVSMKKLIPIILILMLLFGCSKAKEPVDYVSELLGTDTSEFAVTAYYDTHSGWLGDGETVLIMSLTEHQETQLLRDTQNHFCRYDLPFSQPISIALYGGEMDRGGVSYYHGSLFHTDSGEPIVPQITNGFYLFYDRHSESTDPSNDFRLHYRGSWNFDLAVYDADTRTLYYLVLDT